METLKERLLAAFDIFGEIVFLIYKRVKELKCAHHSRADDVDGPVTYDDIDKEMFLDASRQFLLHLYLTEDETAEYENRRKICWEQVDPIECKKKLDEEYRKIVFDRLQKTHANNYEDDFAMKMYVSGVQALVWLVKNFAEYAGLSDVQCKTDYNNKVTWLRIPQVIENLHKVADPTGVLPQAPKPTLPPKSSNISKKKLLKDEPVETETELVDSNDDFLTDGFDEFLNDGLETLV